MKDRAVILLHLIKSGKTFDVDVPLDITASDLLVGISEAYGLDLAADDASQRYLKAENPIALLHGNKTLGEYGIVDGSIINVTE